MGRWGAAGEAASQACPAFPLPLSYLFSRCNSRNICGSAGVRGSSAASLDARAASKASLLSHGSGSASLLDGSAASNTDTPKRGSKKMKRRASSRSGLGQADDTAHAETMGSSEAEPSAGAEAQQDPEQDAGPDVFEEYVWWIWMYHAHILRSSSIHLPSGTLALIPCAPTYAIPRYALMIFEKADEDEDSKLSEVEYLSVLNSPTLNVQLPEGEAAAMLQVYDLDGDGALSYEEFKPFLNDLLKRAFGGGAASSGSSKGDGAEVNEDAGEGNGSPPDPIASASAAGDGDGDGDGSGSGESEGEADSGWRQIGFSHEDPQQALPLFFNINTGAMSYITPRGFRAFTQEVQAFEYFVQQSDGTVGAFTFLQLAGWS